MPRRNTSALPDEEIFASLRSLFEKLGHIPAPADFNSHRDFPLNATGMLRRYGSPGRAALLAGIWFPQPPPIFHEPIDIEELTRRDGIKSLFESDAMQTLFLGGAANPEGLLVGNITNKLPVGGMATAIQAPDAQLFQILIQPTEWRIIEVTESARAHLVYGALVLPGPDGELYRVKGEVIPAVMLVTYDIHDPYGIYFDGRFVLPRNSDTFHLNTYIRASLQPLPA